MTTVTPACRAFTADWLESPGAAVKEAMIVLPCDTAFAASLETFPKTTGSAVGRSPNLVKN